MMTVHVKDLLLERLGHQPKKYVICIILQLVNIQKEVEIKGFIFLQNSPKTSLSRILMVQGLWLIQLQLMVLSGSN